MIFEIPSASDWKTIVGPWAQSLQTGDVLLLEGAMAAGKTTFVREILGLWGFQDVASPTYALHHRYENSKQIVDHWDLFRLKDLDDLEGTSFWDLLAAGDSVTLIEWPGLIPYDQLPTERRRFHLLFFKLAHSRRLEIRTL